ncbi:MAG: hypothetical protein GY928_34045 [Colwellia sp.]|nr:hypothetical protein [Colwellia sp.]
MAVWGKKTVAKFLGGQITLHVEGQKSKDDYVKDVDDKVKRSHDMTPAMRKIGLYLMGSIRRNFKAEGRPQRWKPLANATIQDRLRKGFGSGPILQRTGALMNSLTKPGAKGQIFSARKRSLQLSSRIPYFPYHQRGTSKIPQRVMLDFQKQDRSQISRIINRYILTGKV